MPASRELTRKSTGIVTGILLLMTFLIPFGLKPDKTPVWSWEVLKHFADMPGELKAFFLSAWGIGLLALIFGASLRRLALATCYLILGVGGLVVLILVFKEAVPPAIGGATGSVAGGAGTITFVSAKTLAVIGLILLGAFLIVIGIRGRVGANPLTCILQILVSGAFGALVGIGLHDGIRMAMKLPPGMPTALWWDVIIVLIIRGLLGLAALFAFIHGFAFTSRSGELTAAARGISYTALLGIMGYTLIANAVRMESAELFLMGFNPMLMVVCMILVFLEGSIGFLGQLIGAIWEPPPEPLVMVPMAGVPASMPAPMPAGAGPIVAERLRQLDALRAQGTISAEEYASQRARILQQL